MKSFFVGSFFTKTNLASLIGILAYFVSYLPFILVMSLKYELTFAKKFGLVSLIKNYMLNSMIFILLFKVFVICDCLWLFVPLHIVV